MKIKLIRFLLLFSVSVSTLLNVKRVNAKPDPLEIVTYDITAEYNPATHTITAQQTATYLNSTPEPIPDVVIHLYLNAFRNAETVWMKESALGFRGMQYDPMNPGWMDIETIYLSDGTPLKYEALDDDETLIRIELPEPISFEQKVSLKIEFKALLPRVFARTGWEDDGDFVLAGQWFPKFGVWQHGQWNAYPFRANSEFYADFGAYHVQLQIPENWIVGTSAVMNSAPQNNSDGTITYTFSENNIIDFVWTASPHYREITHRHNDVDVHILFYPEQRAAARRILNAAIQSLDLFHQWIGPYGNGNYSHLTIVIVPPGAGGAGGMEYPSLFTVGSIGTNFPRCFKFIEVETIHELAHQWFQSVIATNEAEEPWLDEGFADYITSKALSELYNDALANCGDWLLSYQAMQRASYLIFPEVKMAGNAWDFGMEYSVAVYAKPVVGLTTLERLVGEEMMLDFLQAYFKQYAYKHPTAKDVQLIMSASLGEEGTTWFFDNLVASDATLDALVAEFDANHVTLERRGDACLPTRVRLTTKTGLLQKSETKEIIWSCDDKIMRIDGAYRSVEIDPQHNILIDLNLANNSATRTPGLNNWLGVTVRVLKDLQNLYWSGAVW